MGFEILGEIVEIQIIASGRKLRQRSELRRRYGQGRWRKLKGVAPVRLASGEIRQALHWYEAHGVGRARIKIKRFVD